MVRNDELTSPTRVATREVSFTVTIGIEQFGNFRLLQICERSDVVFIGRFFVNHVALQHARHDSAGFHHRLIAAGLLVERFVQFLPQMY
ncbi:hypothetical protein D9M71_318100 [compost metagenome]